MGRPYGIGEACRDLNAGSVPLRYQVGYRPPPYASLRPPVRLPRANNDAAMNTQKGALIRCLRQRVRPAALAPATVAKQPHVSRRETTKCAYLKSRTKKSPHREQCRQQNGNRAENDQSSNDFCSLAFCFSETIPATFPCKSKRS